MMRTLAALLAIGGALAWLGTAAADETFAVGAGTDSQTVARLRAEVPSAEDPVPDVVVPLGGLAPQGASNQADTPPIQRLDDPATTKETSWSGLPPKAQNVAAAAGAGAGAALLLALAAHAAGIPLFSRIQSNRLLDNGVRQRVHDTVVSNPGITIKEITGVCAIGWGTAVYHLKRLEAERLLVSERNRQFRRYFKNGGGIVNDAKAAFGELKNPLTERLAQSILRSPGRCQKDLCETVGISAPLAHKYLSRLADAGLVSTQREWKTVKYFPTSKLEGLLLVGKPAPGPQPGPPPVAVAA